MILSELDQSTRPKEELDKLKEHETVIDFTDIKKFFNEEEIIKTIFPDYEGEVLHNVYSVKEEKYGNLLMYIIDNEMYINVYFSEINSADPLKLLIESYEDFTNFKKFIAEKYKENQDISKNKEIVAIINVVITDYLCCLLVGISRYVLSFNKEISRLAEDYLAIGDYSFLYGKLWDNTVYNIVIEDKKTVKVEKENTKLLNEIKQVILNTLNLKENESPKKNHLTVYKNNSYETSIQFIGNLVNNAVFTNENNIIKNGDKVPIKMGGNSVGEFEKVSGTETLNKISYSGIDPKRIYECFYDLTEDTKNTTKEFSLIALYEKMYKGTTYRTIPNDKKTAVLKMEKDIKELERKEIPLINEIRSLNLQLDKLKDVINLDSKEKDNIIQELELLSSRLNESRNKRELLDHSIRTQIGDNAYNDRKKLYSIYQAINDMSSYRYSYRFYEDSYKTFKGMELKNLSKEKKTKRLDQLRDLMSKTQNLLNTTDNHSENIEDIIFTPLPTGLTMYLKDKAELISNKQYQDIKTGNLTDKKITLKYTTSKEIDLMLRSKKKDIIRLRAKDRKRKFSYFIQDVAPDLVIRRGDRVELKPKLSNKERAIKSKRLKELNNILLGYKEKGIIVDYQQEKLDNGDILFIFALNDYESKHFKELYNLD